MIIDDRVIQFVPNSHIYLQNANIERSEEVKECSRLITQR